MYFLTYKYDIGVTSCRSTSSMAQDWTTFKNFDIAKGLPVTTGPWQVVSSSPEQKVIDRRDSWWAVDRDWSSACPRSSGSFICPVTGGADGPAADQQRSRLLARLRPLTMETDPGPESGHHHPHRQQTSRMATSTGGRPRSTSTTSASRTPTRTCAGRSAITSIAIRSSRSRWRRRQHWPLPLPSYPGLQPFIDGVPDLLTKYPTLDSIPTRATPCSPARAGPRTATASGPKDGKTLDVPIDSFQVMADIGPVIAEQCARQGIDASFAMPPDFIDRFTPQGDYNAALFGHGGSVSGDPYSYAAALSRPSRWRSPAAQVNFSQLAERRLRQDRRRDGRHLA